MEMHTAPGQWKCILHRGNGCKSEMVEEQGLGRDTMKSKA